MKKILIIVGVAFGITVAVVPLMFTKAQHKTVVGEYEKRIEDANKTIASLESTVAEFTKAKKEEEAAEAAKHEMDHGTYKIEDVKWKPTVKLTAEKDKMSGWNVQLETTDFAFAPWAASKESKNKEGHAHIYVDGTKISRVYGNWFHLPNLKSGEHEITVSLVTNDHKELLLGDAKVEASTKVVQE